MLTWEMAYVICNEVRSYEADVTDEGWFTQDLKSAPRNEKLDLETTTQFNKADNQANNILRQNNHQSSLQNMSASLLDRYRLTTECQAQKEALLMQARQNNPALVAACGR